MNVRTNRAQVVSARGRRAAVAGALLGVALAASPAHAGPNEQARRIYERIAGVPPSPQELATMAAAINGGCSGSCAPGAAALVTAAQTATSAPTFYSVTLKNMVIPRTNRDQTVFAPFNDYAATVIGMVRDDVPFNTALSADILYVVNGVSPAPSSSDNDPVHDHYGTAEANGVDLMANLKQTTQSAVYGTPTAATAGLLTTRAAEASFFINGTNRAMFRYTMINHFCNDMQTLMDTRARPIACARTWRAHRAATAACSSTPASAATAAWTRWRRHSPTTTSTAPRWAMAPTPARWCTPRVRCSRST